MAKKSDAKRKAQLKERRKKAAASAARSSASQTRVAEWMAASDAATNIIADLVDEDGAVLAYVEGDAAENWTVVVGGLPVAGSSDEFAALSWFLSAAVDDKSAGNSSFLRFSPWLLEEIEKRCEAQDLDWYDFLISLLPPEKRHLALPEHKGF